MILFQNSISGQASRFLWYKPATRKGNKTTNGSNGQGRVLVIGRYPGRFPETSSVEASK